MLAVGGAICAAATGTAAWSASVAIPAAAPHAVGSPVLYSIDYVHTTRSASQIGYSLSLDNESFFIEAAEWRSIAHARAVAAARAAAARAAAQRAARRAAARRRAAALAAAQRAAAERAAAKRAAAAQAARQQAVIEQSAQQPTQQPTQQPVQQAPTQAAQPVPSGSPQQIAEGMLGQFGWSASQFSCLQPLWQRESGWNVYAQNPSSGAYGIPQALPGSRMATAGADWQTDAATQIRWGLTYISGRYGSPCGAWAHEEADGWY